MSALLEAVVARLPLGAQPYAKALVPVVLAAGVAVERLVETGQFDGTAVFAAVGGAVTAILTYAAPNRP